MEEEEDVDRPSVPETPQERRRGLGRGRGGRVASGVIGKALMGCILTRLAMTFEFD